MSFLSCNRDGFTIGRVGKGDFRTHGYVGLMHADVQTYVVPASCCKVPTSQAARIGLFAPPVNQKRFRHGLRDAGCRLPHLASDWSFTALPLFGFVISQVGKSLHPFRRLRRHLGWNRLPQCPRGPGIDDEVKPGRSLHR